MGSADIHCAVDINTASQGAGYIDLLISPIRMPTSLKNIQKGEHGSLGAKKILKLMLGKCSSLSGELYSR
jgi:hypothetical protein